MRNSQAECTLWRSIRRVAVLASILTCALPFVAGPMHAQTTGAERTEARYEETIEVHEVRLTVRVDNVWGRPVEGLTADDFSITEDGEPVEIVAFRQLGGAEELETVPTDDQPGPGPASSPTALADETVLLLVDLDIAQGRDLARNQVALQSILDWIDTHPEEVAERTWLVGLLGGSAGIVGSSTRDPGTLRSKVAQLKEQSVVHGFWRFIGSPLSPTVREAHAGNALPANISIPEQGAGAPQQSVEGLAGRMACVEARTLLLPKIRALGQVVESLVPMHGRKTVIWVHGPVVSARCDSDDIWDLVEATRELGALAAASGVVVHTSSLTGMNVPWGLPPTARTMHLGTPPTSTISVAANMAYHTGGQRVSLNDPSWVFHRAFDDPAYEITVQVPHGPDGEDHHLHVDLEGHPLSVLRYQRRYLDLSRRQLLMRQLERFSLLAGSYGALPVHLASTAVEDGDAMTAEVTVAVPADRVGLLEREGRLVAEVEPYVAVHTLAGELVDIRQLATADVELPEDASVGPASAFTATTEIRLAPGEYLFTGAFYDRLNETSGVTSVRLDLSRRQDHPSLHDLRKDWRREQLNRRGNC